MKNEIIASAGILVGFIFFIACQKTDDPKPQIPEHYWGFVTVEKNNAPWTAYPYAKGGSVYGGGIVFDSLTNDGKLLENLVFLKIPYSSGRYTPRNTFGQINDGLQGAAFFIMNDDLTEGYYQVMESDSANYIEVLNYDAAEKTFEGSFQVSFIAVNRPPGYPDTIRFTNGVFKTRLIN